MPSRDKNKHKPRHHRHAVQPSIKPMPPLPGTVAVQAAAVAAPAAAVRSSRFRIAEPKHEEASAPPDGETKTGEN